MSTRSPDTFRIRIRTVDNASPEIIRLAGERIIGLALDITAEVNGTDTTALENLIKITLPIPASAQGSGATLYRLYDGVAVKMPVGGQNKNDDGEYAIIGKDTAVIYVKYLFEFAIAYTKRDSGYGNSSTKGWDLGYGWNPRTGGWNNPFADVKSSDWFYDAVRFINELGIMGGIGGTTFAPHMDITRAMFVTVLYRAEGEPEADKSNFTDVETGSYYEKAVAWAEANGIVNGISATRFAPNATITREQMAAIIQRYAAYKGMDVTAAKAVSYADSASISGYSKEAVMFCTEQCIMSGKSSNKFDPKAHATRAEVAVVLQRVLTMLQS